MRSCLQFVLLFCLAGPALLAQGDFYLPQVANGQADGLGIRTTFVLFNPTDSAVGAELSLTDNEGNPMAVSLSDLGNNDTFSLSFGPGETLFLQTDGQGTMQVGAATIQSGQALGVSAVFTISRGADSFVTEAGVGGSVPQTAFVAPVDTTGSFDTGLAVFNVGLMEASLTLRLVNTAGATTATVTEALPARGHRALFVSELFQGLGSFRGTLRVESTRPLSAIVLRQNLATLTSTTLPVVSAVSQQKEFSLPQVASGTYPAGSIRTSFILFNLGQAAAEVDFSLTRAGGVPFPISIPGVVQSDSSFRVNLAPGGSAFLETGGQGDLSDGAALVWSNVPIGLSSVFTLYDRSGNFETEAGVGDSRALSRFTIPVDTTGTFDTGVALFNPSLSLSSVTVRLLDSTGTRLGVVPIMLVAGGHRAFMAKQEFGGTEVQGSLAITATSPLSALTLRLHADPLSYTTLPTAASAFAGFVPRPPLLTAQRTSIDVQEPVHVDVALEPGVKLSGFIGGQPASVQSVRARSADGRVTSALVDPVARRYSVAVAPGSYTLITCYKPSGGSFQGAPVLTYERPETVEVAGATRADIVLPAVPLVNVSGTVEGLGNQTLSALVRLTSEDGRSSGESFVSLDHRFSLYVPAGTYVVSLAASYFDFGPVARNDLALYDVGSITVAGSDLETSFSVPELSTLFGKIEVAGIAMVPAGSFISARDAGSALAGSCAPDPARSVLGVGSAGDYRATLTTNHVYDLAANLKLSTAADAPVITFPLTPRRITLTGNQEATFSLPALPGNHPLDGIVRAGGDPVADVVVVATSDRLNGLDQATVRVVGRSNARGEFLLTVPAGTEYRLEFIPPAP